MSPTKSKPDGNTDFKNEGIVDMPAVGVLICICLEMETSCPSEKPRGLPLRSRGAIADLKHGVEITDPHSEWWL